MHCSVASCILPPPATHCSCVHNAFAQMLVSDEFLQSNEDLYRFLCPGPEERRRQHMWVVQIISWWWWSLEHQENERHDSFKAKVACIKSCGCEDVAEEKWTTWLSIHERINFLAVPGEKQLVCLGELQTRPTSWLALHFRSSSIIFAGHMAHWPLQQFLFWVLW